MEQSLYAAATAFARPASAYKTEDLISHTYIHPHLVLAKELSNLSKVTWLKSKDLFNTQIRPI